MIVSRDLRSNLAKNITWVVVISILVALMMAMYPVMLNDNMRTFFEGFIDDMGSSTANALGFFESIDFTDIESYIGFSFQYIAVLIAMFAMQIGSTSLAKEQSTGAIEYIYMNPIDRSEIVTKKLISSILNFLIFLILLALLSFGIIKVIPMDVEPDSLTILIGLAKVFAAIFLSGFVYMSLGILLSSISNSVNFSEAVSVIFVFITAIIGAIGRASGETMGMITSFLPLEAFSTVSFAELDFSIIAIVVNIVVSIVFILIAYGVYNSKELNY